MDERPVETTRMSLSAAAPGAPGERRADERFLTLYRVGSITIDQRRELCLIKNVSSGGMRIRAYSPLAVGASIEIELKSGQPVRGTVTWVQDSDCGVEFDQPVDIADLLSASAQGPKPRMPRIEVDVPVTLREGARTWRVTACDISQGGLKLSFGSAIDAGANVVVTLPGLRPIDGVVCWRAEGSIGVAFNRPIPLQQIMDWIRERQGSARSAG